MMKKACLFTFFIFLTGVGIAFPVAALPTETNVESQQALVVGQNVAQFSELASKTMKGLLYCIGVLFLGAGLYRRFGLQRHGQVSNPIEILSQRIIAPRMNLLLVRVEGQKMLLATTPTDVRLLSSEGFEDSANMTLPEQAHLPLHSVSTQQVVLGARMHG